MQTTMTKLMTQMSQNIQSQMQQSFSQLGSQMESALKIDATAFQKAIQFNMSEDDLTDLMKSAMLSSTATYDSNLQTLGYADLDAPSQIKIYPQDLTTRRPSWPNSTPITTTCGPRCGRQGHPVHRCCRHLMTP